MIVELDTNYNHYQIADTYYSGRPARVLYSGQGDAAQSGIAQDGGADLLFDYNQRFRELVQALRPKRVLILGGGAFTLPTALMQEFPKLELDIVELDRELVDVACAYFGFCPNDFTNIYIGDGCRILERLDRVYDVIIMDVFNNATIPTDFQSFEVAQDMRRCLTKQGTVAINVIASLRGRQSAVLRRMQHVMQAAFHNVQIFPAGSSVSSWFPQNFVMTAQDTLQDLSIYLRYPALNESSRFM